MNQCRYPYRVLISYSHSDTAMAAIHTISEITEELSRK